MADTKNHKNVMDPFQCNCRLCVSFWKDIFGSSADVMFDSYHKRMQESSDLGIRINDMIKVGDRVSVHGKYGVVKFVGFVDDNLIAPKVHVGVKLDDNVSSLTNGIYEGKRYFYCTPGHGIMVPYREVKRLRQYVKTPNISNNSMFPSWNQVRKARKDRQEKLEAFYRSRSTSPRLYDSYRPITVSGSYHNMSQSRLITQDKNDMVYKDSLRYLSGSEKRDQNERVKVERSVKEEKKVLMKLFGTGERAERLGETLKYLQRGYKKGQEEKVRAQRHHNLLSDDED